MWGGTGSTGAAGDRPNRLPEGTFGLESFLLRVTSGLGPWGLGPFMVNDFGVLDPV